MGVIFFKVCIDLVTILLLFYVLFCFGHESCGILTPRAGTELSSSALEGEVLATGPPGNSPLGIYKSPPKAPHMGWLRTIEVCSLTELGAGSLKSGWRLQERILPFSSSFWKRLAFDCIPGSQPHCAGLCLCCHTALRALCVPLLL